MTRLVCIGVPYWLGNQADDSGAVNAARQMGIADELDAEWIELSPHFSDGEASVVSVNRALAEAIIAQPNDVIPLILAADCTSCWGAVKGLEAHVPDVLWYDAHGDFNTPETSPSGFLGGMPLAAMVGRGNEAHIHALGFTPIAEDRVTITDARDLDLQESEMVRDSAMRHMIDVMTAHTALRDKPLYIHFDNDIVRLDDIPAVSYPAKGGPTLEQCIGSLQAAIENHDVKAVLITLWNNQSKGANQSAENTLAIIKAVAKALQA